MARVIAIGGLKGGTGKSTLAVNLACQLAAGLRVHLIDVDRQESAQEWLAGSKLPVMGALCPWTTGAARRIGSGAFQQSTRTW